MTEELKSMPEASLSLAEFFQRVPPSKQVTIADAIEHRRMSGGTPYWQFIIPKIEFECEVCGGNRFFRNMDEKSEHSFRTGRSINAFISFICGNCESFIKIFSVHAIKIDDSSIKIYKFGEIPPFGPSTPSRLLRLFGNDKEIFLKGRRCESQGLGIGAFAYYRRVIEGHKDKIFDEIIKVAKSIGIPAAQIEELEAGKKETQFAKAVQSVKSAVPQALLIKGHNPLLLLHSALSEGLHAETDEACLESAQAIRIVMVELADRIGQVLKDQAELNDAVSRLMKKKNNTGVS